MTVAEVKDAQRLAALRRTTLLDTPPEEAFDRLTRLVGRLLGVPVSLVSLVDTSRQFFKSAQGLAEPWATLRETPLSHSFCQHVVASSQPLIIENAHDDPLVCGNPAIQDLNVVAYLGIPLLEPGGQAIGSLCAIDSKPRRWSEEDVATLSDVADIVMREIALRESEARFRAVQQASPDGFMIFDSVRGVSGKIEDFRWRYVNPAAYTIVNRDDLLGKSLLEEMPGHIESGLFDAYESVVETGKTWQNEFAYSYDGFDHWFRTTAAKAEDGFAVAFTDITEQKRAEVDLRASEKRLPSLIDNLFTFVALLTPEGELLEANQPALDIASLTLEDVRGQPFWEAYWWSYSLEIQNQLREAIRRGAAGETSRYDVQVRTGPDRFITIDFMLAPILDEEGRVTHLVPSGLDISERLQTEREFRVLANSIPQLAWMTDAEGWIYWYNKRWYDYTGTTLEEMQGWGWQKVHHPEHVDRVVQKLSHAFETGEPWEDVFPLRSKTGEYRWFLSRALPLRNEQGEIEQWFGTNTDVTERRRLEQELRRQSNMLELSHDAIIVWQLGGGIETWNWGAAELYGHSAEDAKGQISHDLLRTEHPVTREAFEAKLLADGQWQGTLRQRTKDGREVTVSSRHQLIQSDGVVRVLEINRDITERLAAQQELHNLNKTLESRVQQRTVELERKNAELDQFAYVASHDLKAPLRAIDNLATWVFEDAFESLPDPSKRHLEKLRSRVERLENLLDDLLNYARADRHTYLPERVELRLLVAAITKMLAPPPGFQVEFVSETSVVTTTRVPLQTVLRNLINNALKHHDRSEGRITITAKDQGEWLDITVSDDGPGIAPEFAERAFQLFQTLKPRDQVEGSGMGLAVVRKIVEAVGGTITLHASEDRGASFRFTWPQQHVVEQEEVSL